MHNSKCGLSNYVEPHCAGMASCAKEHQVLHSNSLRLLALHNTTPRLHRSIPIATLPAINTKMFARHTFRTVAPLRQVRFFHPAQPLSRDYGQMCRAAITNANRVSIDHNRASVNTLQRLLLQSRLLLTPQSTLVLPLQLVSVYTSSRPRSRRSLSVPTL